MPRHAKTDHVSLPRHGAGAGRQHQGVVLADNRRGGRVQRRFADRIKAADPLVITWICRCDQQNARHILLRPFRHDAYNQNGSQRMSGQIAARIFQNGPDQLDHQRGRHRIAEVFKR